MTAEFQKDYPSVLKLLNGGEGTTAVITEAMCSRWDRAADAFFQVKEVKNAKPSELIGVITEIAVQLAPDIKEELNSLFENNEANVDLDFAKATLAGVLVRINSDIVNLTNRYYLKEKSQGFLDNSTSIADLKLKLIQMFLVG